MSSISSVSSSDSYIPTTSGTQWTNPEGVPYDSVENGIINDSYNAITSTSSQSSSQDQTNNEIEFGDNPDVCLQPLSF